MMYKDPIIAKLEITDGDGRTICSCEERIDTEYHDVKKLESICCVNFTDSFVNILCSKMTKKVKEKLYEFCKKM